MRLVPTNMIKEGSYLARTIFDDNSRVLLREGIQLNSNLINRLQNLGIFSAYINDEYSGAMIDDVIKPELRQKAIKTIKETFYSFDKYNSVSSNSKNQNAYLKEKEAYFKSIGDISKEIVEELISQKNILINLVDIKSTDNYTYQHSVNVAVLSLILGIQLQLSRQELSDLCMGALVHDIGKALIPIEIVQKNGPLTQEEFDIVKEHTTEGYNYLRGCLDVSSPARVIALQHHERFDGSGYPEHRSGLEISKLARIVAIADVYDALTSDRPYRKALNPNDAVEYIMAFSNSQFDYQIVQVFSKAVVPYPEGTLVQLSNSDIAVVEEVFPNYPLRPKVKVVKSNDTSVLDSSIDLRDKLGLVISGIQYAVS